MKSVCLIRFINRTITYKKKHDFGRRPWRWPNQLYFVIHSNNYNLSNVNIFCLDTENIIRHSLQSYIRRIVDAARTNRHTIGRKNSDIESVLVVYLTFNLLPMKTSNKCGFNELSVSVMLNSSRPKEAARACVKVTHWTYKCESSQFRKVEVWGEANLLNWYGVRCTNQCMRET